MASAALLGLTNYNNPLLRNIVPCAAASLVIQYAVGIPSTFLVKPATERFYDLSGAITNVAVVALSLLLPRWRAAETGVELGPPNLHQIALSSAVVIWAARLGAYLFRRILREGKDTRFDPMRERPARMMVPWTAQAVWVVMCQLPVMAVNAIPPAVTYYPSYILPSDTLGFGLFAFGLAFEWIADWQKATWVAARDAKEHDEVFINSGLFKKCQYPHYFGEMTLWTGIAVVASGVLTREPVQRSLNGISTLSALAVAFASPAFTIWVLIKLSGIAMSQRKYDRKYYGRRPDYTEWRDKTPLLIPRLT